MKWFRGFLCHHFKLISIEDYNQTIFHREELEFELELTRASLHEAKQHNAQLKQLTANAIDERKPINISMHRRQISELELAHRRKDEV